jgi:flagellar assembly factor FliW
MSPELEVTRGHKAQRVLKDEMYLEAFSAIQDRIVGLLAMAETTGDQRANLNALLVAHNKVKQYMEQAVLGGKMAAEQIERERTLADRILRRA